MVLIRYVVPSILVALAASAGITYLASPSRTASNSAAPAAGLSIPGPVAATKSPDSQPDDDKEAADFLRAAQAILRRAPNTRAALDDGDHQPMATPVPLPKRRPIPR